MSQKIDFWRTRIEAWTVLDKEERTSEVLFGLIMVLTFTGTFSVSTAGRQDVNDLLWAALGCNLAWGLVDGIMYIMDEVILRARAIIQINKMRDAGSRVEEREIVKDNISPLIAEFISDEEIDHLIEKLKQQPKATLKNATSIKDFRNAGIIFLLVFISTFPVAIPFFIFHNVIVALRVSNLIGLLSMFALGYSLARYTGLRPFITALVYTAIGVFLIGLTILLGG